MLFLAYSKMDGKIEIPYSKSEIHRVLFLGANSTSFIKVSNITYSNDVLESINVLSNFAEILKFNNYLLIKKKEYRKDIVYNLEVLESGTTLRFLLAFISVFGINSCICVGSRLIKRNISGLNDLFKENNCSFKIDGNYIYFDGILNKDKFVVSLDLSSQYASGFLLTLPFYNKPSTLLLTGDLKSYSYINLTLSILDKFNINYKKIDYRTFYIIPSSIDTNEFFISPSWSEASYLIPYNLFSSNIDFSSLDKLSYQGDVRFLDFLNDLGFIYDDNYNLLKTSFKDTVISLKQNPDLLPALIPLSIYTNKTVKFKDISKLRFKESNRIKSSTLVLDEIGVRYLEEDDSLTIYPSVINNKKLLHINSFNDHRIAFMAALFTILGFNVLLTGEDCVNKSFKNFFTYLKELGFIVLDIDLKSLRNEIDKLDDELLNILNKRFLCGALTNIVKKKLNLSILDSKREAEVISRYSSYNSDPLFLNILKSILLYSKEVQKDEEFLHNWSPYKA